jgi:signal transduction histidine kinase
VNAPRPDTLFRIGALVACGSVALPQVARAAGRGSAAGVEIAWQLLLATLFVAAFWMNTRGDAVDRIGRRGIVLFLLQVLIALAVTDYFFVVAATAAFVFTPRRALLWLAVQLSLFFAVALTAVVRGVDVVIPEVAGAPDRIAVPTSMAYLAGWQVFAFATGYLAAGERRSHRDLRQSTRQLLATERMLAESSQVAERAEISRELHDALGHSLTVLNVNLELASHLADGEAAAAIARARTVARMLLADVREVVHSLGNRGCIDLEGAIVALIGDAPSPAVHLSLPDRLEVTDASKAHAVFRCVQEALTNAVRHARARAVWIELARADGRLEVRVRDDGCGAADFREGRGVRGMRERIEAAGGTLRIRTAAGRGFAVEAWIPVAGNAS